MEIEHAINEGEELIVDGYFGQIQEVDAYLGLGIALLEVMVFILLELRDKGMQVLPERIEISHDTPSDAVGTSPYKRGYHIIKIPETKVLFDDSVTFGVILP
jgi:hypothetical protein